MGQIIHPTPVAYKDIDLSWMAGRVISEVSFHEPTLWHFAFGAEASLDVECLWRIIEHGRVVLCGEDHGQQFGLPAPLDAVERATALLSGRRVAGTQLREATADVVIELDGDCRLEIIPDSAGYESWQLRDPSGISYVAQGGGQLCKWRTA